MVGCEDDASEAIDVPELIDLTGSWSGTMTLQLDGYIGLEETIVGGLILVQTGNQVTGTGGEENQGSYVGSNYNNWILLEGFMPANSAGETATIAITGLVNNDTISGSVQATIFSPGAEPQTLVGTIELYMASVGI